MKILMVNKFLYPNGGSETYMFKLGAYLKSIGHEVEYFGMEHEGRCVSNSLGLYTETMDFHNSSAFKKIKLSLKTIYSKEAKDKMLAVLENFKPDVVHLNNFNFQLTPSIIYAVKEYDKKYNKKIKLIYTAHDFQLICPNHMMMDIHTNTPCEKCIGNKFKNCTINKCIHNSTLKSLLGTLEAEIYNKNGIYGRIDDIVCCSEFMKNMLDTNPVFKNKTVTLHNFIDKIEPKKSKKEDYILYFGRFAEEKGIETLIDAKSTNFICAGSGPIEDKVNKANNLKNIGFKTGNELEELIRKAKCTVYPSIWYENCPFSIMESIMYQTPVIASNIGGIPELIDNGKTGYLIPPNDSLALEEAINRLDNNTLENMVSNCSKKEFDTVETYAKKLIEIYNK